MSSPFACPASPAPLGRRTLVLAACCCAALLLTAAVGLAVPKKGTWHTDFAAAKAAAGKSGKPIVAVFTVAGRNIPPCDELEAEVLNADAFQQWAGEQVTLLFVDFNHHKQPDKQKKHNEALRDEYKIAEFPTVVVTDPAGNESARWVGYKKGMGAAAWLDRAKPAVEKAKKK